MIRKKTDRPRSRAALAVAAGAAVVLACAGMVYFVFGEELRGKTVAEQIAENESRLERLEKKQGQRLAMAREHEKNREAVRRLKAMQAELKVKTARLAMAESGAADAASAAAKTKRKFAEYKELYRKNERAAAVGERYPVLTTKNGKTYQGVVVRGVTAGGMAIRHRGGGRGD